MENSTSVISLCHLEHADVWKLTSQLLPRFVKADKYFVYVPSDQVTEFKQITDPRIQVLSEESLAGEFEQKLKRAIELSGNTKRYGWYFQQFLKIEALLQSTSKNIILWDADCVPLREIQLFSSDNIPIYLTASEEFHSVYFETIERMLNIQKVQEFSFVVPGFPILNKWINDFAATFQENYSMTWYDSIIKNTPFHEGAGFSEFETLGTWITNKYPNSWLKNNVNWERLGQSRFGFAKNFDSEKLVNLGKLYDLDIISFENWDHRTLKHRLRSTFESLFVRLRTSHLRNIV